LKLKHIAGFIFCFLIALYIGEDRGQMIAGVQTDVPFYDFSVQTDIRSYVNRFDKRSFRPDKIMYKVGVGYKHIKIYQECVHGVDTTLPEYYIKNGIQIAF